MAIHVLIVVVKARWYFKEGPNSLSSVERTKTKIKVSDNMVQKENIS